jgi:hypothetical protein
LGQSGFDVCLRPKCVANSERFSVHVVGRHFDYYSVSVCRFPRCPLVCHGLVLVHVFCVDAMSNGLSRVALVALAPVTMSS